MENIIVIPDSFKGTLEAIDVCNIMKDAIIRVMPNKKIITIPVADGGEGTVDCFLHSLADSKKIYCDTVNAFKEPIKTYYATVNNTAIIEVASVIGLPMFENRLDPVNATSYGVGIMIRHAIEQGCTKVVLGLGGSCTNDGGVGVAQALGTVFLDKDGKKITPNSSELGLINRIDTTNSENVLSGISISAMCDVANPFTGPNGATHIFSPQKGATPSTLEILEENMIELEKTILSNLKIDLSKIPGSGAAGGIGGGIVAFLNGNLQSGIDTTLDLVNFDAILSNSELVLTGEGRIDSQTLEGKVILGIAKRAKRKAIPVIVIAGSVEPGAEAICNFGVNAIFSINQQPIPFSESRHQSTENLKKTVTSIMEVYSLNSRG